MMKWYDFPLAVLCADMILMNVKLSLFAPGLVQQLVGALGVWAFWQAWNFYIVYRATNK
tara:strand:- start:233 stop:409 length:177 start_codon:yes stop_codon:yes gene_type:complete